MGICGEHGDEIAHTGRECPACVQIEELISDHKAEISVLEQDLRDSGAREEDLLDQLEEKK